MPAWLAPALSAGSTVLGGILGKSASDSAADAAGEAARINQQIAEMNLEFQEIAREEGIEFALQMLEEGRLGTTDALGNRTYFKEGEGWVTELSPLQQLIANRAQQEMLRQGSDTAARVASAEERSSDIARQSMRGFREAMSDVRNPDRVDTNRLRDLLFMKAMGANNEVQDAAASSANRAMLAQGNTSPGRMLSVQGGRADAGSAAAREAAIDAELRAMQYGDQRESAQRQEGSALLSKFGQLAGYSPNMSLSSPTGPSRGNSDAQFGQQLIAAASAAPQRDYQSPDFSEANAKYDFANTITGGLNNLAGYFQNQQTLSDLKDLFGGT